MLLNLLRILIPHTVEIFHLTLRLLRGKFPGFRGILCGFLRGVRRIVLSGSILGMNRDRYNGEQAEYHDKG